MKEFSSHDPLISLFNCCSYIEDIYDHSCGYSDDKTTFNYYKRMSINKKSYRRLNRLTMQIKPLCKLKFNSIINKNNGIDFKVKSMLIYLNKEKQNARIQNI